MTYCNNEESCKYKEVLLLEHPDADKKCNRSCWCEYQEHTDTERHLCKYKRQAEEWLDYQHMLSPTYDTSLADEQYYRGGVAMCKLLGYNLQRDENGKHTIF